MCALIWRDDDYTALWNRCETIRVCALVSYVSASLRGNVAMISRVRWYMGLWCASVDIHVLPGLIKPTKSPVGKGGNCGLLWMPCMCVIVDDWWQHEGKERGGIAEFPSIILKRVERVQISDIVDLWSREGQTCNSTRPLEGFRCFCRASH